MSGGDAAGCAACGSAELRRDPLVPGLSRCAACGSEQQGPVLVVAPPGERRPRRPAAPVPGRSAVWVERGRVLAAFALGWSVVFFSLLFWRHGWGAVDPVAALVGLGLLLLVWGTVLRQGLGAGLVAVAVGLAFLLKPWLRSVGAGAGVMSPSSETAYHYSMPGLGLMVLGAILLLAPGREGRARLWRGLGVGGKTLPAALLGVLAGAGVHPGETGAEVIDRYRPHYETIRGELRSLHTRLAAGDPGPAEAGALALTEPPRFAHLSRDGSTAEILGLVQLASALETPSPQLYLSGNLLDALEATHEDHALPLHTYWRARPSLEHVLQGGLAVRTLGVYAAQGSDLDVWLVDRQTGDVLAYRRVATGATEWGVARWHALEVLSQATGVDLGK